MKDKKIVLKKKDKTQANFYSRVKEILETARISAHRAVNSVMVQAYWNIGKEIVEQEQKGKKRAGYGARLIEELSSKLTNDFGQGFTQTNLVYMRQFYLAFPIYHAVREELSWTHYRLLLKVENAEARKFYIQECIDANWSTRALERQIYSFYYERLLSSRDKLPVVKEAKTKTSELAKTPRDFIKDPYVLEFLDLRANAKHTESDLETAIIDKLQEFLLELGKGFSFIARQKRISADNEHFYIDLVFYNYILKCFLVIDLKAGKLTHQDIGQMDMYVRLFEDKVRGKSDNPTIGLILCTEKNSTVVKYSVLKESKQIFASKYKLYLPSEKELMLEIKKERKIVEIENKIKQ